jgi:hypothetical protein
MALTFPNPPYDDALIPATPQTADALTTYYSQLIKGGMPDGLAGDIVRDAARALHDDGGLHVVVPRPGNATPLLGDVNAPHKRVVA